MNTQKVKQMKNRSKFIWLFTFIALATIPATAQIYLPVVNWYGPSHPAEQSKPGYLDTVRDPVYGTYFKRVADYAIWNEEIGLINNNETRHYYSLRPVFNRNSTMYIVNWEQIRMVETNEFVGRANQMASNFRNPTWSKVDPDILYGTIGLKFVSLNVITKEVTVIRDLGALDGFKSTTGSLYMDNFQSIAGEDKYMAVTDVPRGGDKIVIVDIQNKSIHSSIDTLELLELGITIRHDPGDPNARMNVGISLSGNYIVMVGGNGLFLFDDMFNLIRELPPHGHGDFGYDVDGNDVLVSICPAIYEVLETGEVYDLLGGTYACGHVNASANYLQPGWAYLSINKDDNDDGDNGVTQDYEIVAVRLDPEGKTVRKVIHPHNTGSGLKESSYGVPNADGSLLMFNSAWDDFSSNAEFDAYMAFLTTQDSSAFSLETVGKGVVTSDNEKQSGMEGYYYESYPLVLTATDTALGYSFSNWSGDVSSTDNPFTVILDTDKHVVANFDEVPVYTLTTTVKGEGKVSSKANGKYNEGTEVTITAFPNWGYEFLHWEGDLTGNENPVTIRMDSTINITAVFSGPDGIIDHNGDGLKYNLKSFPNPVHGNTTISYELDKNAQVRLSVMNTTGRKITVLVNKRQMPGDHSEIWNATGDNGNILPNGLYFIVLEVDNRVVTTRSVIINR